MGDALVNTASASAGTTLSEIPNLGYDWTSGAMVGCMALAVTFGLIVRGYKKNQGASAKAFCRNTMIEDVLRGATILPMTLVLWGIFDPSVLMEVIITNRGILATGAAATIIHSIDGFFRNNGGDKN